MPTIDENEIVSLLGQPGVARPDSPILLKARTSYPVPPAERARRLYRPSLSAPFERDRSPYACHDLAFSRTRTRRGLTRRWPCRFQEWLRDKDHPGSRQGGRILPPAFHRVS